MSSGQILDSTQKLALQYVPANVLPATSTQIAFGAGPVATNGYPFTPSVSGSYIIELTQVLAPTGTLVNPAGSYIGFGVAGPQGSGAADYGATIAGSTLVQPVAPLTQTHAVCLSTHDLTAGTTYTINTYNNAVSASAGAPLNGWVIEATGPL